MLDIKAVPLWALTTLHADLAKARASAMNVEGGLDTSLDEGIDALMMRVELMIQDKLAD